MWFCPAYTFIQLGEVNTYINITIRFQYDHHTCTPFSGCFYLANNPMSSILVNSVFTLVAMGENSPWSAQGNWCSTLFELNMVFYYKATRIKIDIDKIVCRKAIFILDQRCKDSIAGKPRNGCWSNVNCSGGAI